jgi:alkylated DNA repair protein (DNA oxidative demethylase)
MSLSSCTPLADGLRLFGPADDPPIALDEGAWLLPGWAAAEAGRWVAGVQAVVAQAPWRVMRTPGGAAMSVATSNCGAWGWVSDASGYAYRATDPLSGQPWPALPDWLGNQARAAAAAAGYPGFAPDACLINCYAPGAKMSLHRDADERDASAPIVSISLGLPATFLWGGLQRGDRVRRMQLEHGDVLVWGGAARMTYHGVSPLKDGQHQLLGSERWNLTFRMARALYR